MAARTTAPQTPTLEPAPTPYDVIYDWGADMATEAKDLGMPTPEMLTEVSRSLHAVQEFMLVPIADLLKFMVRVPTNSSTRGMA